MSGKKISLGRHRSRPGARKDQMHPVSHRVTRAALGAACLLLAACGSNRNPLEVTVERCPAFAVLGGTGSLTQFAGEERETSDVFLEASISNLSLECDQGDDVISSLAFTVAGERGPAMGDDAEVVLPYFVAVLRDNGLVVAKEIYETRLRFGPDMQRAVVQEELRQRLPTIEQARRYDYEILVGFQLSQDELSYNLLR